MDLAILISAIATLGVVIAITLTAINTATIAQTLKRIENLLADQRNSK